jgi:hypothetical protein
MINSNSIRFDPSDRDEYRLPALYATRGDKLIVLFTEEHCGMVVGGNCPGHYPVGHIDMHWISCINTTHWRRLGPGEVVELTNV